jgi:hypothetical protein
LGVRFKAKAIPAPRRVEEDGGATCGVREECERQTNGGKRAERGPDSPVEFQFHMYHFTFYYLYNFHPTYKSIVSVDDD